MRDAPLEPDLYLGQLSEQFIRGHAKTRYNVPSPFIKEAFLAVCGILRRVDEMFEVITEIERHWPLSSKLYKPACARESKAEREKEGRQAA